ncbi:hypothetical protein AZ78_0898 [Lysobacter capsici AZ78]|uniref:DUF6194 domain-containing protein n=1 Tax=Lysobacter capsici AZ78 TaxID=1444315 RepID=A0A120AFP5_9GAMM|nr:DUF6194 family protein [Lysobacter capsici]KWS03352.1 hypothetical protein AZ78_0898 [Lysobacter capsici AZ78]WND82646.1 DUF6194 family protein [Lysobacter capsici]WND87843.1 DUF6194 family protein [Lysobacter capsici]
MQPIDPAAEPMTQQQVIDGIVAAFDGVEAVQSVESDWFFFFGAEHHFPFATVVNHDNDFDHLSRLDRDGVFRLNLGLSKSGFAAVFEIAQDEAWDYTALDRLMPHPMYARMHWVSVLNPSRLTFERLQPLLAEAYELAQRQAARRPSPERH